MLNDHDYLRLLTGKLDLSNLPEAIELIQFQHPQQALVRFTSLCDNQPQRDAFLHILPACLYHLQDCASPDQSLLNLERYLQSVEDRLELFQKLSQQPRALEILMRLFVGSQYLSEILLRNPAYLDKLTDREHLVEFKSRYDFVQAGLETLQGVDDLSTFSGKLRHFQQWELLRIAACDTFGLLDLKTVTLQLSLLADAIVQLCVEKLSKSESVDTTGFCVIAFGKLGGEELNYSSDIDLIFICNQNPERLWSFGQKLIKLISESTEHGFLYRVDMRLRPWGSAGALVITAEAYVDYLKKQGQLWEKQALIKARPIAGNLDLGRMTLNLLNQVIYDVDAAAVRENILEMKAKIESSTSSSGKTAIDVKRGPGGIRDIEFITQYLQLIHSNEHPILRSTNTIDAQKRLTEAGILRSSDFRKISSAYSLLRNIEHALQIIHNQPVQILPVSDRELSLLSDRLDFPDAKTFQEQYQKHTQAVREIYNAMLLPMASDVDTVAPQPNFQQTTDDSINAYEETFTSEEITLHGKLLSQLNTQQIVKLHGQAVGEHLKLTVAGFDQLGDLSALCGLLYAFGFNIVSGYVFTGHPESHFHLNENFVTQSRSARKYINSFIVNRDDSDESPTEMVLDQLEYELNELIQLSKSAQYRRAQGRLAKRVVSSLPESSKDISTLLPVEIDVYPSSEQATLLRIRGEDTPGFLYELTNAITMNGLSIIQMTVHSQGRQVVDTLHVVEENGNPLENDRILELRAAIVLIRHFTHFLPHSPNPEQALDHFREFLDNLFRQDNWLEQLSPLENSAVLDALARLLGMSDFLWDDFLKLQHENLFPVISNLEGLQTARTIDELRANLQQSISGSSLDKAQEILNEFKDREMMRVDMRHILRLQQKFEMFSLELSDVAEVVIQSALQLAEDHVRQKYGQPIKQDGTESTITLFALGKCGGRELGFASDIELMFIYDGDGKTDGSNSVSNVEYFQKLIEQFQKSIRSKRKGIFEVDLRLRPYGNAGGLVVSLDLFKNYFQPGGDAWPYERQALVKLRPIAGDKILGQRVIQIRDELLYRGKVFDVPSMRAMREKQNRQLVSAGTFNAKLSPGGLVDCEYIVQGMQITYGHLHPDIRHPNTREAMKALERAGVLLEEHRIKLRDAYRFLRRVIDGLRMVRGDASDLTVPHADSEEFEFLVRRLGYGKRIAEFQQELERHTLIVMEMNLLLEESISTQAPLE